MRRHAARFQLKPGGVAASRRIWGWFVRNCFGEKIYSILCAARLHLKPGGVVVQLRHAVHHPGETDQRLQVLRLDTGVVAAAGRQRLARFEPARTGGRAVSTGHEHRSCTQAMSAAAQAYGRCGRKILHRRAAAVGGIHPIVGVSPGTRLQSGKPDRT